MNTALNNNERALAKMLQEKEGNNPWLITARQVIGDGINWKIRRMFAALKSERSGHQDVMRMIIGQEVNELLERL
jgi:hypothetical protein